ncbi:GH92 family glycosyl hydrolase [Parachryseolinea silvisoli]|uniref:GH92 family glycosyl hydrolase n=1 Tax=Parachryseolinea silvisoli TaxID=2873601 RepID=UPI002265E63B|nr:GH92 family glycosyl hydrolase [Parachryseolinea silvisoli]MCD9014663.1 GH92 family glycosyl hydrolase [Parachryseolinea silvisoli]
MLSNLITRRTAAGISAALLLALTSYGQAPLSWVDPRVGNVGHLLEPTRPTAQLPNQAIRSYPGRKDHLDPQISTFPLSLVSHRQGHLFGVMPYTGAAMATATPPRATWDPENEVLTPYYYSEWLDQEEIEIAFVPGAKTGHFRIVFPAGSTKNVFLQISQGGAWQRVSDRAVSGTEQVKGMTAWVYGEFSKPGVYAACRETTGKGQACMSWAETGASVIEFKYAISFISAEQARKNLVKEQPAWDFDGDKQRAQKAWERVLNQIEVKGGTDRMKRTFYTALYRCQERMVNITEDGKYYSHYDKRIHDDSRPFYVDDWVWDTYLAHHPLRTILNPAQEADMIASYLKMYQQSGWLPTFPLLWGDNPCMNGFHSTITLLDAYRKGIQPFDLPLAYEAAKKNATQATMLPWRNGPACSLDSFYHQKGYYPALHPDEKETVGEVHSFERRQAVAITLGHSYDDWALSQLAVAAKHKDDYALFLKRSANYQNLYQAEKGFFMPKDANGKWIDIDPTFDGGMGGRDYYDENNGWTYLWQVQQDIPGLMTLMGGKQAFEARLDQLFQESLGRSKYELWAKFPDFTGIVGQYSMGNEPSFHIPYLYNFTGAPWKTQKRIRMLLNTWYPDNIFGIPGDEDGGGMSAFVVFSCMGFYPIVPGLPLYTIGSPVFEKTTIHLPNGKDFQVDALGCSEQNKFIQEAYLNGKRLDGPWMTHTDIVQGGVLKLVMGPRANKTWGANVDVNRILQQATLQESAR